LYEPLESSAQTAAHVATNKRMTHGCDV